LFFCFNTLSSFVFSSFEDRAAKFEQDLLFSFSTSKISLINNFNVYLKLQQFVDQFTILVSCLLNFLSQCLIFLEYKPSFVYYQAGSAKFNELVLSAQNFVNVFQKACVVQLLYSLIANKYTHGTWTYVTSVVKPATYSAGLKSLSFGPQLIG
jgi:hypothetical protein